MVYLDAKAVRKNLQRAIQSYEAYSILQKEVADHLLRRLDWVKINPMVTLDLGMRMGHSTSRLAKRFLKAHTIGFDIIPGTLKKRIETPISKVSGDFITLPFKDQSVDLIFSNMILHEVVDCLATLQECYRILKPNGLLFFSTAGPDTLQELRASFETEDHIHPFLDMHDLGDALIDLGFEAPVMDVELFEMQYKTVKDLLLDLKFTGVQNALIKRSRGLLGRKQWLAMLSNYQKFCVNGLYSATVEVIYAHAWKPLTPKNRDEVLVPISKIQR